MTLKLIIYVHLFYRNHYDFGRCWDKTSKPTILCDIYPPSDHDVNFTKHPYLVNHVQKKKKKKKTMLLYST